MWHMMWAHGGWLALVINSGGVVLSQEEGRYTS